MQYNRPIASGLCSPKRRWRTQSGYRHEMIKLYGEKKRQAARSRPAGGLVGGGLN